MSEVGQLRARLEALAPHSTTALFNALEYRNIPLRGPLSLLARAVNGLRGWGTLKLAVILFACLAVVCTLTFVRAPCGWKRKASCYPETGRSFIPR